MVSSASSDKLSSSSPGFLRSTVLPSDRLTFSCKGNCCCHSYQNNFSFMLAVNQLHPVPHQEFRCIHALLFQHWPPKPYKAGEFQQEAFQIIRPKNNQHPVVKDWTLRNGRQEVDATRCLSFIINPVLHSLLWRQKSLPAAATCPGWAS